MADGTRSLPRQSPHNGMARGGRPIRVPLGKATVRQLLRRHLAEDGKRMQDLVGPWQCQRSTVYGMFSDARPFSPAHIDAAIAWLRLDDFDANELRLLGAREAGWNINPRFILEST
jgi:hypothetical protein